MTEIDQVTRFRRGEYSAVFVDMVGFSKLWYPREAGLQRGRGDHGEPSRELGVWCVLDTVLNSGPFRRMNEELEREKRDLLDKSILLDSYSIGDGLVLVCHAIHCQVVALRFQKILDEYVWDLRKVASIGVDLEMVNSETPLWLTAGIGVSTGFGFKLRDDEDPKGLQTRFQGGFLVDASRIASKTRVVGLSPILDRRSVALCVGFGSQKTEGAQSEGAVEGDPKKAFYIGRYEVWDKSRRYAMSTKGTDLFWVPDLGVQSTIASGDEDAGYRFPVEDFAGQLKEAVELAERKDFVSAVSGLRSLLYRIRREQRSLEGLCRSVSEGVELQTTVVRCRVLLERLSFAVNGLRGYYLNSGLDTRRN